MRITILSLIFNFLFTVHRRESPALSEANYLQAHLAQCVFLMRKLRPREGTGLVGGPGAAQSLGWFTTQVRTPTDLHSYLN